MDRLNIIDSHQHFWLLERGDYHWLTPELNGIYRDFMPADLACEISAANVAATVLVQAAATDEETDFMLSLAASTPFIAGVVGWLDFESAQVEQRLVQLAGNPLFKGVRPMLQLIPEPDWVLNPDFDPLFKLLVEYGLSFDALVTEIHLPFISELASRYPELNIVIDHCAKPMLRTGELRNWLGKTAALAVHRNIWVKLSGLLTEAKAGIVSEQLLAPCIQHLLTHFGCHRVMWGSDWPVVQLNGNYQYWLQLTQSLLAELEPDAAQRVMAGSAMECYRIDDAWIGSGGVEYQQVSGGGQGD